MTTESLTSTTASESRPAELTGEELDAKIAAEESAIQRMLLVVKLKRLGYRLGDCDYCGARTGDNESVGTLVYVKKLPNKLKACVLCHDRRSL